MQLEHVLRAREADFLGVAAPLWRTSDSYFLTIFGRPGIRGHLVDPLPRPPRLPQHHGREPALDLDDPECTRPAAGDRRRGAESRWPTTRASASQLLDSLDDDQRAVAVIHDVAPADFVSRQVPLIGALEYPDHYDLGMPQYQITTEDRKALALVRAEPSGIAADRLDESQQAMLQPPDRHAISRGFPAAAAAEYRAQLDADGPSQIHFAWAGGLVRGTPALLPGADARAPDRDGQRGRQRQSHPLGHPRLRARLRPRLSARAPTRTSRSTARTCRPARPRARAPSSGADDRPW